MKLIFLFILTSSALVGATPSPIPFTNWTHLGECTVKYRSEKDVISVGAKSGSFRQVKLKVKRNAIRLTDLKIHFANGEVQDVAIRSLIKAGGETRAIDLAGKSRVIKKVTLRYESLNRAKAKANVVLLAKH